MGAAVVVRVTAVWEPLTSSHPCSAGGACAPARLGSVGPDAVAEGFNTLPPGADEDPAAERA